MTTTREQQILTTLDALLRLGHVASARLIIAEAEGKRLEDPDVEPLQALDDAAFEALSERIKVEAFRRERLVNPHLGDRWAKLAQRVIVGDVACFKKGEGDPRNEAHMWEREVKSIRQGDGWLKFEFVDGLEGFQTRQFHMMVVRKRPGE